MRSGTREAIDAAGWMHTGDLATIDDEGLCRIVGRIKDMVIRGGANVYPREDRAIPIHSSLNPRRAGYRGPRPKIRRGSSRVDHPEAGRGGGPGVLQGPFYKIPRYVRIVKGSTVTGKVQKFLMREVMVEELSQHDTTQSDGPISTPVRSPALLTQRKRFGHECSNSSCRSFRSSLLSVRYPGASSSRGRGSDTSRHAFTRPGRRVNTITRSESLIASSMLWVTSNTVFGSRRSAAGFAEGAACPTCIGTITTGSGANFNPFSPFYMDGAQWQVGTNVTWTPVKDLDIGVEVIYVANDDGHRHFDPNRGYPFLANDDAQWLSRLKISRAF
jgi:hypothetical protein